MSDPRAGRLTQPQGDQLLWWVLLAGIVAVAAAVFLWAFAGILDPALPTKGRDPLEVLISQLKGQIPVGGVQLTIFFLGLLLLAGLVTGAVIVVRKAMRGGSRIDHLASSMGNVEDYADISAEAVQADTERLGAGSAGPGVPLAVLVNTHQRVYATYEWVQIWIMGPRAGKTSCVCIPQIIETNGPVVATSNKRDLVDMTRGPRSRVGTVWVHDVQGIIGEPTSWWWDPLSYVTDMQKAEALADVFITSATSAGAKQDAYFESDGKRVLSHMFFAAAVSSTPITDIFFWAQDPNDRTARNLLIEHGYPALGKALGGIQNLTEKQRDGVYGTMRPWITVLSYDSVAPWIRDTGQIGRAKFDHRAFATSTDTIYLVSKEGAGSASALTAALVVAIMEAAEETAATMPGGRLRTPMMTVLDEAANVVRWRGLPATYTHYGSRGIIISTFFQTYEQGVGAFGEEGMSQLWGAANIRVAGSGLSSDKFLSFLSKVIGEHDVVHHSESTQKAGSPSVSTSIQRESILSVSDLAAIPRGRAIMTSSGMPAALLRLRHFSETSYGPDLKASKAYYESLAAHQRSSH